MFAQAFIFDLDGTLVDSRDDLTAAVNFIRSRFGLARLSSSEVVKYAGKDFKYLVENTVIKNLPDADLDATLGGFRVYYRRNMTERTKPYPGIKATLEELAKRGAKLAVASNKPVKLAKEVLNSLDMLKNFKVIMGPEDVGNGKGDRSKLFAAIASALKVKPSKCLVVADTSEDIRAARSARMNALGVVWGFGDEKDLLAAGATQVLVSTDGLKSFIASGSGRPKKAAKAASKKSRHTQKKTAPKVGKKSASKNSAQTHRTSRR